MRRPGRAAVAALAAAALGAGCAGFAPWVQRHAAELAAVGLAAGTAAQVEQAVVGADELARRAAARVHEP